MNTADSHLDSFGMVMQSPRHCLVALLLAGLAVGAFLGHSWMAGAVVAAAMDVYLALLVWTAICKSSRRRKRLLDLPYRGPALWILLLALICLVSATASTYRGVGGHTPSGLEALYASFMSIASFSYDPRVEAPDKATQVLQLASGILLLLTAFPILLSRVSDWKDSNERTSVNFNGVVISLPSGYHEIGAIVENEFSWASPHGRFVAT